MRPPSSPARAPADSLAFLTPSRKLGTPPPRTSPSGAYFLTHAHSDHLVGLSDSWDPRGRPIYCSAITRALLELRHPALLRRADVRVVALAPDAPAVIQLDAFSDEEETASVGVVRPPATSDLARATFPATRRGHVRRPELLTVTPLDAGHCPGSLAFLFEGACGRIFHTGDFRREDWCGRGPLLGYDDDDDDDALDALDDARDARDALDAEGEPNPPPSSLPSCLTRAPIDLLLLDNTYADPRYRFPPRKVAAAQIATLVRSDDAFRGADVQVGVDALGKEPLLAAIARATGAPVRVTPERARAAEAAREAEEAARSLIVDEEEEQEEEEEEKDAADARGGASDGEPGILPNRRRRPGKENNDRMRQRTRRKRAAGDVRRHHHSAPPAWALTSSPASTSRVFAVPKQRVTRERLRAFASKSRRRVAGILPTGWAAGGSDGGASIGGGGGGSIDAPWLSSGKGSGGGGVASGEGPAASDPPLRAVAYSLHAPHEELVALVAALRPRAVVGNTRNGVDENVRFAAYLGAPSDDDDEEEEEEEGEEGGEGGRGGGGATDASTDGEGGILESQILTVTQARPSGRVGHAISDALGGAAGTRDRDAAARAGTIPRGATRAPAGISLRRATEEGAAAAAARAARLAETRASRDARANENARRVTFDATTSGPPRRASPIALSSRAPRSPSRSPLRRCAGGCGFDADRASATYLRAALRIARGDGGFAAADRKRRDVGESIVGFERRGPLGGGDKRSRRRHAPGWARANAR